MAAPAKTIPLRSDQDAGASVQLGIDRRFAPRQDTDDRRRLNVSEKLAEGRGFWRGAFVGASIGAAAGMVSSVGVADMWTKQVLETVQQSAAISTVFHGDQDLQAVHKEAPNFVPIPTSPNGTGDAR